MAGHSKWTSIEYRKEWRDAKKGKIFTKPIRELTVAVGQGGGVPVDNPRLRLAVDKVLTTNITRGTIDRTIARGVGSNDADNMTELSYEGYAPSGVVITVEAMTDNRNRTIAEVRHASSKCGGNLGADGSIAYMFERKRQINFTPSVGEEVLMDAALETGTDDTVVNDDGSIDVFATSVGFISVSEALATAGFKGDEAEATIIPSTTVTLDLEIVQKVLKLIDMLENPDNMQNVHSNADAPNDVMVQLD